MKTTMKATFASDNYAGVHPEVMNALMQANQAHAPAYGADEFTERAVAKFRALFGEGIEVFFAYNGTGANVLGLSALTQSYKFMGCKLVTIPTRDGKIYPQEIEARIQRVDDQHHPQARVISISQTTEYATVYTVDEVRAIADVARKYNLYLHMDGSRISNAAVALGRDFREFTVDAGVDVLSFGGTKNGMMFGEAVVFFKPELARHFKYIRKQGMQLHSKMRFISSQFEALLSNDLWKRNAAHANRMARLLEAELREAGIPLTQKVDANGLFALMPPAVTGVMQQEHFFYVWNEKTGEVRLMCAFDTTEETVKNFGRKLRELTGK
jgi:threonine aldolase